MNKNENEDRSKSARGGGTSFRLLGACLGVAGGLLFDSMLLVLSTGWFAAMIVPVVLPVLLGATVGALIPGAISKIAPRCPWLLIVSTVVIVWPFCAAGPLFARWLQLRLEASQVPMYPGATVGAVRVTVVAFDNNPGFVVHMETWDPPHRCADFYRRELPKLGWQAEAPDVGLDPVYWIFSKTRRRLNISATAAASGFTRVGVGCAAYNLYYDPPPRRSGDR